MSKFIIYLLGVLTGLILHFFFFSDPVEEPSTETADGDLTENVEPSRLSSIDEVEIKGRKGYVFLHAGMPKDSVKMLVGKPDKTSFDNDYNGKKERWEYKFHDNGLRILLIDFVNGRLNRISEI